MHSLVRVIKRGSRVVDIPYEINVDHPPIIAHSKLIKAQPLFPSQTKPDRNRIPNVIRSHFPLGRSHWCINSSGGFLFIRFNLQLSHCKDCSSVREALDLGFPPSAPNLALMVLLMDKKKFSITQCRGCGTQFSKRRDNRSRKAILFSPSNGARSRGDYFPFNRRKTCICTDKFL